MSARLSIDADVRVCGRLDGPAQVRRDESGCVWLFALIGQPAHSLPLLAAQQIGATPAHDLAAHAKARLLRHGAAVMVIAQGLQVERWQGRSVLRLVGTTDVVPLQIPAPHHEPSHQLEEAP